VVLIWFPFFRVLVVSIKNRRALILVFPLKSVTLETLSGIGDNYRILGFVC